MVRDLEMRGANRGLDPLPQATADLVSSGVDGQPRLPVAVDAAVLPPGQQHHHPVTVPRIVERLYLEAGIEWVVGDLEVQHPVDEVDAQIEGAQQRLRGRRCRGNVAVTVEAPKAVLTFRSSGARTTSRMPGPPVTESVALRPWRPPGPGATVDSRE